MAALRVEADDSAALAEELKTKNKTLEQENLAKEQEITSLSHKNQLLEAQVEKMETDIKEHKTKAEEGLGHQGTNESLSRKLQVLEEEAETADRNLRETNEKYVYCHFAIFLAPRNF
jgi:tropomyosin